MLLLKDYQQRALDMLREYLRLSSSTSDPDLSFYQLTRREYHAVEQLPEPPYVCLRVPTGGGKTLMACHAVAIAAQELMRQENAVVLWLVPTNTIKDQTLAALRNRQHPYRQALESTLGGFVTVMDIDEALRVQRTDLDCGTAIIVSTLATPRIGDTDKRKLYDQNGYLMPHFHGYSREAMADLEKYEGSDKPIPSLANVLTLRRPVVIMDEAHNARTELAFDTLARFRPSCIIEFTATPSAKPPAPSNVLIGVSAAELKAAQMIKLPIILETPSDWRQTILSAKNKRDELEQLAEAERVSGAQYLRPIVLVQAQKRNEELDVDTVVSCLKQDIGIPESQIAVETGERSDLQGRDVFSQDCDVRYIVTVDKLREGWDCSFAYVLCSVRDVGSRTAVEQIIGRVLRMPAASRRASEELNRAYAFVTSAKFAETAHTLDVLAQALVGNGFTAYEAREELQRTLPGTMVPPGGLFDPPSLCDTPARRGEVFAVPQLALWEDGELEPVERTHFLQAQWRLADCDSRLSEKEFASEASEAQRYEIDVDKEGHASRRYLADLQYHLGIIIPCEIKTKEQLVLWLDRHIHHPDIVQTQSTLFLMRMVDYLANERGIPLERLIRERLRLCDAAAAKIGGHRSNVVTSAYQQVLFAAKPEELYVGPECAFSFDPFAYPVNERYEGSHSFAKHYYSAIGKMNSEEADCAFRIDQMPNVRYWVRNLERRPESSFWLPTSTDRFYPDFVAQLTDDRLLAVEYKGGMLDDSRDTEEKTALGKLWAERSGGKCVFLMVTRQDYDARLRGV